MNVDSSTPLVTECSPLDRYQGQFFFMAFFMLLGHLFNWSLSEFWPPFHLIHPVPYYQSLLGTWPCVLAASSICTLYKSMLLSALSSFLWAPGLHSLLSLPGAYMGPTLSLCTKLTTEWKPEMSSILPMATHGLTPSACMHPTSKQIDWCEQFDAYT